MPHTPLRRDRRGIHPDDATDDPTPQPCRAPGCRGESLAACGYCDACAGHEHGEMDGDVWCEEPAGAAVTP